MRARARVQVGAATRAGFETGGGISGSLAPDLCGSIVALVDGNDGALDNRIGARPYDAQHDRNVRGRLVWEPTSDGTVEAIVFDRTTHDRGGEIYLPVDLASFNALPTLDGLSLGRFDQALDHEGSNSIDATLAAITARWHGDSIALTAQLSTRRSNQKSSTDYDLSPQPWFVMDSSWRVRKHSADLRAESDTPETRVQWSAGVSADYRDLDTFRLFNAGPGNPFQLPQGGYVRTDARLPDRTESAFAEGRIALDQARRWQFTLGARMQWTQRELDFGTNALGAPAATLQRDDDAFFPKATLDWSAGASAHLYASLALNGKPGGFNPGTFSADQSSYAPEHLRAAEIGARGRADDDAFEWHLVAFRNRVRDYQDLTIAETEFTTYVRNVRRATMHGLEASADWHPAGDWRIGARLGRVDAHYDHDVLDPLRGTRLDGHRLPMVPHYNASIDAEFHRSAWYARIEGVAAGDYVINAYDGGTGVLREASIAGYRIANLTAGWSGQHASVVLYARNLTDRRYFNSATFGFAGVALYPGAVGAVGERRTVGVDLRWDY